MEVVGGVSGVITVISSVTKLSKNLNEIREKYKNVALNTTLVASQLSTIRAALEAIADWRRAASNSSQYSKQLDEDLGVSLNCCAILITVIDSKLGESGYMPGMKDKIRHLWLEDVMKEYVSNLEGQVRALQLLLTIFQCRTATEQSRRLEKEENRTVIENLRAETASLQPDSRELHDAASLLSLDLSVNLEVDSILLRHPIYKKVYENYNVHRQPIRSPSVTNKTDAPSSPDETLPNQALEVHEEAHGRHYQHRLPQLESIPFEGRELDACDVGESSNAGHIEDFQSGSPETRVSKKEGSNENQQRHEETHPDYFQGLAITSSGLGLIDHSSTAKETISGSTDQSHEPLSVDPDLYEASIRRTAPIHAARQSRESKVAKPFKDPDVPFTCHRSNADASSNASASDRSSATSTLGQESRAGVSSLGISPSPSVKSNSLNEESLYSLEPSSSLTSDTTSQYTVDPMMSEKFVILGPSRVPPSPSEYAQMNREFANPSVTGVVPAYELSSLNGSSNFSSSTSRPRVSITLTPPHSAPRASTESRADRVSAQAELSRLQQELAKAKARGDKKSAQDSLQQSIKVIRETYLSGSTTTDNSKMSNSLKLKTRRSSLFHLPSLASLTHIPSRTKSPQVRAAIEAARSGDEKKLMELLNDGVDVNSRSSESRPIFVEAAIHGRTGCLEMLRARGADELAADHKGLNALHMAVLAQQPAAVEWLLDTYRSNEGEAMPSSFSKSSITRSRKSLRESSDREGLKPIHCAARHGLANLVIILLRRKVNIEAKCNEGGTPLHHAVISGHAETVAALLSSGANIAATDAQGSTSLHYAANSNKVEFIHILLTSGANRSVCDKAGFMPIHVAAKGGRLEAVEALTQEKADLEIRTTSGDTLLHLAVLMNQLQMVQYLLENKVDANPWSKFSPAKVTSDGRVVFAKAGKGTSPSSTPLHSSCFAGNYEILTLLLDHGAWVNAATPDGKSPLMLAIESDDTNVVYLLLARGAKVDAKIPVSLITAQHMAVEKGNLETIQILHQYGASLEARTYDYNVPSGYVNRCKDPAKREAMLTWFQEVRRKRAAQSKELQARKDQQTNGHGISPSQNLLPPQAPYQDPMALIRQLSPAYSAVDPRYDTFPEAPPPYVAGPSAPARLAGRSPVYRPPGT